MSDQVDFRCREMYYTSEPADILVTSEQNARKLVAGHTGESLYDAV